MTERESQWLFEKLRANAKDKISLPFSTLTRGIVEDKMEPIKPCSEEGQHGRNH